MKASHTYNMMHMYIKVSMWYTIGMSAGLGIYIFRSTDVIQHT